MATSSARAAPTPKARWPALPGPIRAARCYGAAEEGGSARIWLELLAGRSGRDWNLADYAFAADQLGRFHAACTATRPLADAPWLGRDLARSWLSILNFETAWADPNVRAVFPPALQRRLEQFWAEHARFLAASERLPQVFSHNDYKSRNLFIRPGAPKAPQRSPPSTGATAAWDPSAATWPCS